MLGGDQSGRGVCWRTDGSVYVMLLLLLLLLLLFLLLLLLLLFLLLLLLLLTMLRAAIAATGKRKLQMASDVLYPLTAAASRVNGPGACSMA